MSAQSSLSLFTFTGSEGKELVILVDSEQKAGVKLGYGIGPASWQGSRGGRNVGWTTNEGLVLESIMRKIGCPWETRGKELASLITQAVAEIYPQAQLIEAISLPPGTSWKITRGRVYFVAKLYHSLVVISSEDGSDFPERLELLGVNVSVLQAASNVMV